MPINDLIVEFLARKENLHYVFQVEENVETVRDKLQSDFWSQIKQGLDKKLANPIRKEKWLVKQRSDKTYTEDHGGIFLYPSTSKPVSLYLTLHIFQENYRGNLRIYLAPMWNREKVSTRPESISEIGPLAKDLEKQGFVERSRDQPAGFIWTDWYPRKNDFLIRISENLEAVATEVITFVWEYFDRNRHAMEQANKALVGKDYE